MKIKNSTPINSIYENIKNINDYSNITLSENMIRKLSYNNQSNILKVLSANLSELYNIILINIKFNKNIPITSTNFKNCTFKNINNSCCLYLNGFGTIALNEIDELTEKTFNCFVYSKSSTLNILLIDPISPNFIYKNKNNIHFVNFTPDTTILNIPCYTATTSINLINFKYISEDIDCSWEFYGKKINDTAIVVVNDTINNKIFGNLRKLSLFTEDLYIICKSLEPSSTFINLDFTNIKVNGSLFIILPDNYGITLNCSNCNIIKQL